MAVSSTMLALGTPLPVFSLPDTTAAGKLVSSDSLKGKVAVVAFICNHCPYVIHVKQGLVELGRHVAASPGAKMVAVSSNDVSAYPEDGPGRMAEEAHRAGYPFPYLYDESQSVARAFQAACTPEIYVFDPQGPLRYRGRLDDSTPKNGRPVTGKDVRAAIDALLAGNTPDLDQQASIGCSIKWKDEH
ncbi:MAG TPA: thioredoxin family protein [Polyangiaceae bacterium]